MRKQSIINLASSQLHSNLNNSNIFGTICVCSRHGLFELQRVNQSDRSGINWG